MIGIGTYLIVTLNVNDLNSAIKKSGWMIELHNKMFDVCKKLPSQKKTPPIGSERVENYILTKWIPKSSISSCTHV
jgi:hypothetical protein